MCFLVRASAYRLRQLEGELHNGRNSREGRKRQPTRLRATKLQNTNYRGGRQDFTETRSRGNCSPYVIVTSYALELRARYQFKRSPQRPVNSRLMIFDPQVTATDGDKDRPQNIVYFLTGQGIDPDNPANSKFDINRTTGEIFVLKVCTCSNTIFFWFLQ